MGWVFKPLIDNILKVLVPAFRNNFQNILDIVGTVINGIGGVIEGLLKMLNGIIDFLVGVFTGDWRRAWEGVSRIFEGIANGLVAIFKTPINVIISGINSFLRGLNRIQIPDWVPGVGGRGFNIREIPHLAKGGVINSPTLAMVGERGKEAVVPLENNTQWMEKLASILGSAILGAMQFSSNTESVNREIIIELDGTKLGRVILPKLNQEADRLGYKPILQT